MLFGVEASPYYEYMLSYRNSALADQLLQRTRRGECLTVPHATPLNLGAFIPERSKCHENVRRWCDENQDHKPVRGWIVTGTIFDKHSVVDCGSAGLLDVTPLPDRNATLFLPHAGTEEDFDKLPNQVIALDI